MKEEIDPAELERQRLIEQQEREAKAKLGNRYCIATITKVHAKDQPFF